MRAPSWLSAVALVLVPALVPAAQSVQVWDFEQGLGPWQTLDKEATLTVVVGEGEVAQGSAALSCTFTRPTNIQQLFTRGIPGAIFTQMTPVPDPVARCLDFAARSKLLTPLLVSLSEEDGSRYEQAVTLTPGEWHRVRLYLSDFRIANDSRDENGQLDASQINTLGLIDGYALFLMLASEAADEGIIRMPAVQAGENEIRLDDMRLTDKAAPEEPRPLVDASSGPLPGLTILGGQAQVQREETGLAGKPCWHVTDQLEASMLAGFVWMLPRGYFLDSAGVRLVLGAGTPCMLILQVKEIDGSEYNVFLPMQAGQVIDQQFPWPDFKLGDDSADENSRLDIDQISELILIDVAGIVEKKAHSLDLRLGLVKAAR